MFYFYCYIIHIVVYQWEAQLWNINRLALALRSRPPMAERELMNINEQSFAVVELMNSAGVRQRKRLCGDDSDLRRIRIGFSVLKAVWRSV